MANARASEISDFRFEISDREAATATSNATANSKTPMRIYGECERKFKNSMRTYGAWGNLQTPTRSSAHD